MTIHTLEKEKHSNFLTQNRIDPITGDLLKENDEIVICASCKSAFLVDSWEYMDKKHCNQRLTLEKIPTQELIVIDKFSVGLNVYLNPNVIQKSKTAQIAASSIGLPFTALTMLFLFAINSFSFTFNLIYLFSFLLNIFPALFWVINDYKDSLTIKGKFLLFNEKKKKSESIPISSIKNIRYYKPHRYWAYNLLRKASEKLYTLEFTLESDKKYKVLVPKKTIDQIESKTNILQKFSQNSLISPSTQIEIEQHTA